jgi:hypothetical protein
MRLLPLLAVSFGALLALRLAAAPAIHCDQPAQAFGEQPAEKPVIREFRLENRGDADLVIGELKPGCAACTRATVEPKVIPPGGRATLTFHLNLTGFRGLIRKNVYVFSNDPATPRLEVSLTGTVVSEIMLTPESLSFAAIPHGGSVTGRVEVVCTSTNRMVLTRAVPSDPFLSATVTALEEGTRYLVEVVARGEVPASAGKPKPGALAHRLEGHLVLHLDHPTLTAMPLVVRGYLREKVFVTPPMVAVVPDMGPDVARVLMLSHEAKPDFAVTAVTWPEGGVDFEWQPLDPTRGRLTLRKFSTSPTLNGGEVILRTNMPGKEELRLPLRILGVQPATPTVAPAAP